MRNKIIVYLILAGNIGLLGTACGPKKESTPAAVAPSKFEDEPEFRIADLTLLGQVTTEAELPYLIGPSGARSETPCYAVTDKPQSWATKNPRVLHGLQNNDATIQSRVIAWAQDQLLPAESSSNSGGWQVAFEGHTIVHAGIEQVRLAEDAECIDETAALPAGSMTVTTLFGVRELAFKSAAPIDAATMKKMRGAAKKARHRLKARSFDYPRAEDAAGNPLKDEKGRPLFDGPNGEHLLRSKIPKPKNRPVFEWTLTLGEPLFIAFGDLPGDMWGRELDPARCSVNLIYDDPTPRLPECAESGDAGFGISTGSSPDSVKVKVAADGETVTEEIPFNTRQRLQVAGRVVLWIVAQKLEEGAVLNIDSLVLAPGSGPDGALDSFGGNKKRRPKKGPGAPQRRPSAPPISY